MDTATMGFANKLTHFAATTPQGLHTAYCKDGEPECLLTTVEMLCHNMIAYTLVRDVATL